MQFVKQLAGKGNKVLACCRSPESVKEKLQSMGDVTVTQVDVSDPDSVSAWADAVARTVSHLDVVINNAGIYGPRAGLDDITAEDMVKVFQTNAVGPLLVVQQLRKRGLLGGAKNNSTLVANVTSKVFRYDPVFNTFCLLILGASFLVAVVSRTSYFLFEVTWPLICEI